MYEFDASFAYLALPVAQEFAGLAGVTGIEVKLADAFDAKRVGRAVVAALGFPYWVRDWMDMNRSLFAALQLEKLALFVIVTIIVLVAAFAIIGHLVLLVAEKRKEIGVLKAIGASRQSVTATFFAVGMAIGVAGTVAGSVVGLLIIWVQNTYKVIRLASDVYQIDYLPMKLTLSDGPRSCARPSGCEPRRATGRDRRARGRVRRRQVHAPSPPRRDRPAHSGPRPLPWRGPVRARRGGACPLPATERRLRLPVLQPARRAVRARERHDPGAPPAQAARPGAGAGRGRARRGRPGRPAAPLPGRAVGWRAAARRDRPGPHERPQAGSRRRAHGQSRPEDERDHLRPVPQAPGRARHRLPRRDPQSRPGAEGRAGIPPRRGAGAGDRRGYRLSTVTAGPRRREKTRDVSRS